MKHYEEKSKTESEKKSPKENVKSDVFWLFSEPLICGYFLLDSKHIFGMRPNRESNS
jgi:hypothetical protein